MKACHKCGTQYGDDASYCLRDGEVLREDEAGMTGRILDGQYEIEAFIARGGMGAVYRARHTLLGDRVAIKILPPEMRRNEEWLRRFQREGQAARRFHHPNSVIVHDLRTSSEGEVYLVMEYVVGHTLDKEVAARGGRLAPAEILRLIEPIASVLDAAHAMGVVHRDLKPSNIMITERGTVKLLDLGLAKLSDLEAGDVKLTSAGQMLGTPYYMSPEQWGELQRDGRVEVDGRTDVYSLGVVVYELTTGQRPFEARTPIELRHAHCRFVPRSPAALDANVPPDWASAILHALAKDRSDRPASAGEFIAELRAGLGPNGQRTEAPTVLNPPGATNAALAQQTPTHLPHQTVQAYGAATVLPQQQPSLPYAPTAGMASGTMPRKTNSRSLLLIGLIVLLALGTTAVAGYAIWKWKSAPQAKENNRAARETKPAGDGTEQPTDEKVKDESAKDTSAVDAFMRYHLLLGDNALVLNQRATGRDPIKAGQSMQLALAPKESGYLYLIGEDPQGNKVVMPTGILVPELPVSAGGEVEVPMLAAIKLNERAGTESLTVIFTKAKLDVPFASETLPLDGTFRKLTADEHERIEELRREAAPVHVEYTDDGGGTALVKLEGERGTKPIIFDITLQLEP